MPSPTTIRERLARAWAAHPLVAFLEHRARVALHRQLLAYVRAGEGMPRVLRELASHAPSPGLRQALARAATDVSRGATLADALAARTAALADPVIQLLAAGEQSGRLEGALGAIIEYLEQLQALWRKVLLASIYPGYLVLGFAFFGPLLLLPAAIGDSTGASGLAGHYATGLIANLLVVAAVVGSILAFPLLVAALDREVDWDRVKTRLPGIGRVMRDLYSSRLLLALGFGLAAGLTVDRMLRLAIAAAGSPHLRTRAQEVVAVVQRGGTLTNALAATGLLDPLALGEIAVAERTGTLDELARRLALERREAALGRLKAILIGLLVLVVALMFAVIVKGILAVLLGPFREYQKLPDQL